MKKTRRQKPRSIGDVGPDIRQCLILGQELITSKNIGQKTKSYTEYMMNTLRNIDQLI